jgi:hypothetical protein
MGSPLKGVRVTIWVLREEGPPRSFSYYKGQCWQANGTPLPTGRRQSILCLIGSQMRYLGVVARMLTNAAMGTGLSDRVSGARSSFAYGASSVGLIKST